MFVNEAAHDYRLLPFSPCIDARSPLSPLDPDGSPIDIGYFTFGPPQPQLAGTQMLPDGAFEFQLDAYTNRNWKIEFSTNMATWSPLQTNFTLVSPTTITDSASTNSTWRLYRARLAP